MKTLSIPALLAAAALSVGSAFAQTPNAPVTPAPSLPTMPPTVLPPVPPPETLPLVPPKVAPQSTVAAAVSDATISSKVRDAISSDSDLKSMSVTVDTTDAIVTLNGTADSRAQIARALAVARTVEGVKGVTNVLAVKTS